LNIKEYYNDFAKSAIKSKEHLESFLAESPNMTNKEKEELKKLWLSGHTAAKPYEHKPKEVSHVKTWKED